MAYGVIDSVKFECPYCGNNKFEVLEYFITISSDKKDKSVYEYFCSNCFIRTDKLDKEYIVDIAMTEYKKLKYHNMDNLNFINKMSNEFSKLIVIEEL